MEEEVECEIQESGEYPTTLDVADVSQRPRHSFISALKRREKVGDVNTRHVHVYHLQFGLVDGLSRKATPCEWVPLVERLKQDDVASQHDRGRSAQRRTSGVDGGGSATVATHHVVDHFDHQEQLVVLAWGMDT